MAGDNNNTDLTGYIDKLRVQAMDLNSQLLAAARVQADAQLKLINDQIQAMSRKNAIGAMAARESGTSYPSGAKAIDDDTMIRLMREDIETLENTADLIIRQLAQGENAIVLALDKLLHTGVGALSGGSSGSQSGGELKQELRKVYEVIRETGTANRDGGTSSAGDAGAGVYDLVKDSVAATGKYGGALVGTIIGLVAGGPSGALEGYSKGAEIGADAAAGPAEFRQMQMKEQQKFLAEQYRYRALAGYPDTLEIPQLTHFGMAPDQTLSLMFEISRRLGSVENAGSIATDVVSISKATSVDKETLLGLAELQAGNQDGTHSLAELVAAIRRRTIEGGMMKYDDQASLNEFLGKFTDLHRSFLEKQTYVGTATTMDIMSKFNAVGGQFSMGDSRAMANLSAVQDGLTNPASDSLKAFSYLQLRRLNPTAGVFELMKQQEEGLSGPHGGEYLQSILQYAHGVGSDDDGKRTLSGFFPRMNLNAVEELYNNHKALNGSLDRGTLEAMYKPYSFAEEGMYNTTGMQRSPAEISEGILSGRINGITDIGREVLSAISNAFSGAVIQMENGQIIIPNNPAEPKITGNAIQHGTKYKASR